jgi:hypothetical protein
VLAGYAWYLCMVGRSDDAGPWSERAVAAADESGAPLDRCRALLAWGLAKAEVEAGLDALWQARDLAVQCDNADELGRAHAALEMALGSQGRVAERDHALQDGRRYAAAHGMLRPPA